MTPIVHSKPGMMGLDGLLDFKTPMEIWLEWRARHVWQKRYFLKRIARALSPRSRFTKIAIFNEPRAVLGLADDVVRHWRAFDLILTHDQRLLDEVPNARLILFGTSWVRETPTTSAPKRFEVSFVCGHKAKVDGHRLRQRIWLSREDLKTPTRFLASSFGAPPGLQGDGLLGERKDTLFESQFQLTIENCREPNYFSEKLVDCLKTRTVPIYWGCPNIGKWFNTSGMICAESYEDIVRAVNGLTPDTYDSMRPAVEENFERSRDFWEFVPRLNRRLVELGFEPASGDDGLQSGEPRGVGA